MANALNLSLLPCFFVDFPALLKYAEMLQNFFINIKIFLKKLLQNYKKWCRIRVKWYEVVRNTHKVV